MQNSVVIQLLEGAALTVGQREVEVGGLLLSIYTNSTTPLATVGSQGEGKFDTGERAGQEGTSGRVHGGDNGHVGAVCQYENSENPDGESGGGFFSDG